MEKLDTISNRFPIMQNILKYYGLCHENVALLNILSTETQEMCSRNFGAVLQTFNKKLTNVYEFDEILFEPRMAYFKIKVITGPKFTK